ncbi:2TM domain-containing protein [Aquimarina sp. ERC-38]|uniref:2TM domain-containing protein n=1 Tax=Aquimarina sp. ERC-38 TaxID=2949996 RepID=UPI002248377C|nr:2TM domain-containing protein [Aquimarina sp. ERC-38]UZO81047.1 2TM domain-containing protein [Aquimarina sp. ERC-38]
MFSKKKDKPKIDPVEKEMYEYAHKRAVQKKRLFRHFLIFIIGSVFLIFLNLVLSIGASVKIAGLDWYVVAILFWFFVLLVHTSNVWIFSKFMGKEWTDQQIARLIVKQKEKIASLQSEVDEKYPLPSVNNGLPENPSDDTNPPINFKV